MSRVYGRPAPQPGDPTLSWGAAATLAALGDPSDLPWAVRIDPAAHDGGCEQLRSAPALTYSTSEDPRVDVVIPEDRVPHLLRTLSRRPLTTVTLALLLRTTEHADIEAALVAESLAYSTLQAGPEHAEWLLSRRGSETAAPGTVQVTAAGAGTTVTLDRREAANAIDAQTRAELYAAFRAVAASDGPIDWRGAGAHFSAGGDLSEFGTVSSPAVGHALRMQQNLPLAVAAVGDRLTAHVHGACIGAGMELSSFARTVVAGSDTRWRLPELTMGLLPGCGGTVSIPRRIGRQRALLLMLTGEVLSAETALAWGLVDEVVDA